MQKPHAFLFVALTLFTLSANGNVCSVLNNAEAFFTNADANWFHQTQAQLRHEAQRVNEGLVRSGQENEAFWKELFRWPLLEKNIQVGAKVELADLELVRRWMYSNRKGIESEFFAPLRTAMDAYLDAAYTFSHADLRAAFNEQVALARKQCVELAKAPTYENGVAFGRTLGWFERTRQLTTQVAQLRAAFSHANASVTISEAFIQRVMNGQIPAVSQSTPVNQSVTLPTGLFGGNRTTQVSGSAQTTGSVRLGLVPNPAVAELQLIFNGHLSSLTSGGQSGVTTTSHTSGPLYAQKSLYFTATGLQRGPTYTQANVVPQIVGISASSNIAGRIAQRRANRPSVQAAMQQQAQTQAATQLQNQFTNQVETQFAKSQENAKQLQAKMDGFGDVMAPVKREGASPRFHSSASTAESIQVRFTSQKSTQFGAVTRCPQLGLQADLVQCVHESFINNFIETVATGKDYADEYFREAAKAMQPELPLALVIHSRAPRWTVTTRKHLPLMVRLNSVDDIQVRLGVQRLKVGDDTWQGDIEVAADYRWAKTEIQEYRLERKGEVVISGKMDPKFLTFFQTKMDAFFAEVIDGGGVSVPDGGLLGTLKGIQSKGMKIQDGWIVVGLDVPDSTIQELRAFQKGGSK